MDYEISFDYEFDCFILLDIPAPTETPGQDGNAS